MTKRQLLFWVLLYLAVIFGSAILFCGCTTKFRTVVTSVNQVGKLYEVKAKAGPRRYKSFFICQPNWKVGDTIPFYYLHRIR